MLHSLPCFAVYLRRPSRICVTIKVSRPVLACFPWFSVQPMGTNTISFFRLRSITLERLVVWI